MDCSLIRVAEAGTCLQVKDEEEEKKEKKTKKVKEVSTIWPIFRV